VGGIRAVLYCQAFAGLTGFIAALLWSGPMMALSLVYGVALSVFNGAWLLRRIKLAAGLGPEQGQRVLYVNATLRLMTVLAALFLAFGLGLHLLAVAAGLFLAQVSVYVYAVARAGDERKKTGQEPE